MHTRARWPTVRVAHLRSFQTFSFRPILTPHHHHTVESAPTTKTPLSDTNWFKLDGGLNGIQRAQPMGSFIKLLCGWLNYRTRHRIICNEIKYRYRWLASRHSPSLPSPFSSSSSSSSNSPFMKINNEAKFEKCGDI